MSSEYLTLNDFSEILKQIQTTIQGLHSRILHLENQLQRLSTLSETNVVLKEKLTSEG